MTPSETKRVYERACRVKRIAPQDDEGRAWHRVLRKLEARDVEAALDAWWADTTPTLSGRPRGAFMPEPAELKPVAERQQRLREVKTRVDYCGDCALGWVVTLRDGQFGKVPCGCRERVLAAQREAKQLTTSEGSGNEQNHSYVKSR